MVRVVFAEDNYLVREGTAALLATVDDVELVDMVGDLDSLLEAVERSEERRVGKECRL